jgi:2'-5' RNA ligase
MTNRWESRDEPKAGEGRLYWHILFRDQPQVATLASIGQEKLAGLHGLHFTPQQWLHITTLVPGLADEFTSNNIEDMVTRARRLLSEFAPIRITLGRVFYHPEGIILGVGPSRALDSLRKAIWQATSAVKDGSEKLESSQMSDQNVEDHAALLEARKQARESLPVGHSERVAAERAVRQSRIARRSNRQWAIRALKVAQRRAAQKSDPQQAVRTLNRGIATALQWLDGSHPKSR